MEHAASTLTVITDKMVGIAGILYILAMVLYTFYLIFKNKNTGLAATAAGSASHKRVEEAPRILQHYYHRKGAEPICPFFLSLCLCRFSPSYSLLFLFSLSMWLSLSMPACRLACLLPSLPFLLPLPSPVVSPHIL